MSFFLYKTYTGSCLYFGCMKNLIRSIAGFVKNKKPAKIAISEFGGVLPNSLLPWLYCNKMPGFHLKISCARVVVLFTCTYCVSLGYQNDMPLREEAAATFDHNEMKEKPLA